MKKAVTLIVFLFAIFISVSHAAAADVEVRLNGEQLRCTQEKPYLTEGVVFVPARALVEALGGQVEWNAAEQRVLLTLGEQKLDVQIGSTAAIDIWNGSQAEVTLPAAPQLIRGCTMVPLRAVAEAFCADVIWDAAHRTAHVTIVRDVPVELGNPEVAAIIRARFDIPDTEPILETHLERISYVEIYQNWISFGGIYQGNIETYDGLEKLVWTDKADVTLVDGWDPSVVLRLPHVTQLVVREGRQIDNRNQDFDSDFMYHPSVKSLHLIKYSEPIDLRGMTALRELTLEGCYVCELDNIAYEQLESLYIHNNTDYFTDVYDLTGLRNARNLKSLRLLSIHFRDIEMLRGLQSLETLEIQCCGLRDVSVLSMLRNLEDVVLSNNLISDITPVLSCKKLQTLEADNNALSGNLEIRDLPELESISLAYNYLTTLTTKNTPALMDVQVNHNLLQTEPDISGNISMFIKDNANPFQFQSSLTEKDRGQIISTILQDFFTDEDLCYDSREAFYGDTVYLKGNTVKPEWIPGKVGKLNFCLLTVDEMYEKWQELGDLHAFEFYYIEKSEDTVQVTIYCDQLGKPQKSVGDLRLHDAASMYTLQKNKEGKWEIIKKPGYFFV